MSAELRVDRWSRRALFGALAVAGLPVTAAAAGAACVVPAWFCLDLIGTLELTQIAWWDETHKKQQIGGHGHDGQGSRVHYRFRRGAGGKLDPNGELRERLTMLKVKYPKER